MKAITLSAIFTRFSSRVDGSIGFSGCTPELNSSEKVAMFDLQGKNVKVLLQPIDEPPDELVTVKSDLEQKTPSTRLRAVLFIQFRQQSEVKDFDGFYKAVMERIIEEQKAKLEPSTF
jgi:hypothetical protein